MVAQPAAVIGLDIGTSAVKAILVGAGGRIVSRAVRPHPLDHGPGGRVEVDARQVVTGARSAIMDLADRARRDGLKIRALCAGGSGDEAVWVDADGRPVAPIPMSLDTRSASDGDALAADVGRAWFMGVTGLPPSGAYPIARMRWLRRERPALAAHVRRLLAWPEYLASELGVPVAAEPTLAARTGAWSLGGPALGGYELRVLAAAGVPPSVLSPVVPTGSILGEVAPAVARALGLPRGVAVVAGGFDQAMATLGARVLEPGVAHVGAGSWEAITVLVDIRPDTGLVANGFSIGPSIGGARWSVMASGPGAIVLAWLARIGGGNEAAAARHAFALAARAPDAPTGLLAIPDLAGAAAPSPDDRARGAIVGIGLGDGPDRIGLALLEGVALQLASRLDHLAVHGVPVHELRVTGGGAGDRRWRQLKADATGLPVRAVRPGDAGTAAAAALAATAVGISPGPDDALRSLVKVGRPIMPRPRVHDAYRALGERARALRAVLDAVQDGHPDA